MERETSVMLYRARDTEQLKPEAFFATDYGLPNATAGTRSHISVIPAPFHSYQLVQIRLSVHQEGGKRCILNNALVSYSMR